MANKLIVYAVKQFLIPIAIFLIIHLTSILTGVNPNIALTIAGACAFGTYKLILRIDIKSKW